MWLIECFKPCTWGWNIINVDKPGSAWQIWKWNDRDYHHKTNTWISAGILHGLAFALPTDVHRRNGQKYNPELEHDLMDWTLSQTDNKFDRPEPDEAAFQSCLKGGCAVSSSETDKPVTVIKPSNMPFKQMESSIPYCCTQLWRCQRRVRKTNQNMTVSSPPFLDLLSVLVTTIILAAVDLGCQDTTMRSTEHVFPSPLGSWLQRCI